MCKKEGEEKNNNTVISSSEIPSILLLTKKSSGFLFLKFIFITTALQCYVRKNSGFVHCLEM